MFHFYKNDTVFQKNICVNFEEGCSTRMKSLPNHPNRVGALILAALPAHLSVSGSAVASLPPFVSASSVLHPSMAVSALWKAGPPTF